MATSKPRALEWGAWEPHWNYRQPKCIDRRKMARNECSRLALATPADHTEIICKSDAVHCIAARY